MPFLLSNSTLAFAYRLVITKSVCLKFSLPDLANEPDSASSELKKIEVNHERQCYRPIEFANTFLYFDL